MHKNVHVGVHSATDVYIGSMWAQQPHTSVLSIVHFCQCFSSPYNNMLLYIITYGVHAVRYDLVGPTYAIVARQSCAVLLLPSGRHRMAGRSSGGCTCVACAIWTRRGPSTTRVLINRSDLPANFANRQISGNKL